MKKYVILLILFISYSTYSQYGNNRNQRQRQMAPSTPRTVKPNFDVDKYIGLVIYDVEKAAKKSKVKLKSDEGKKFSETLTVYNKKIKDMRRINSFTLRSTKDLVENFQKEASKSGDLSNQLTVQKTMMANLKPITETLKEEDKKLDTTMKAILSQKQYKKWIKYNKKLNKIFPEEI